MAVFGGISSTGGKGNIAGGFISAFIIVCLRVGLGPVSYTHLFFALQTDLLF